MIPKEKAEDLYVKFLELIPDHIIEETKEACDVAKRMAIIDVEGKISLLESLFDKGLENIHITLESPVRAYRDIINPEIKYWQEVKNHLIKM